jgi:hypothetical protein
VPLDVAKARETDTLWVSQPGQTAARLGLLENTASQFLREIVNNDQVYREIIVTDREGRLVAASSATSDYIQSDETWWKEAFNDGTRGLVSVSDVLWDESTKSHAIEIAVPVTERPGERLVGVLKVVADAPVRNPLYFNEERDEDEKPRRGRQSRKRQANFPVL